MTNNKREIALQIYISISTCVIGILCRCVILPVIVGFVSIYKIMEYMIDVDDC